VLAGDASAPSGVGWLALASQDVVVPSLSNARHCALPPATAPDRCELRTVSIDLDDGAVIVALGERPFEIRIRVSPAFPRDHRPELIVRRVDGSADDRRVTGRALEPCRTELRFEDVFDASMDDGRYRVFLDGFEGDGVDVLLSLTDTPGPVFARDACALTLAPVARRVAVKRPMPAGGIPRPPLVAVDPAGCIVRALSIDARGRALVPSGGQAVELRVSARGGIAAVLEVPAPVRDAAFFAGGIAVATATDIYGFDANGCPADPAVFASGFGAIVGLGSTDAGDLVAIDAAPPGAGRNVRVFRPDGSELAPPAAFPDAGWFAERRNRALVFAPGACRLRVEPARLAGGCCVDGDRDMTDDEVAYFELVAGLPALRARLGHAERGTVILGAATTEQPLDGRRPGTRWNRISLFGAVPPGCSVELQTRTSDDVDDGDPLFPTGWSRPVTIGAGSFVPVAAPGDPRVTAGDAWVLAPPGRFLWIRLTLRGDERATPRIDSVEVERGRDSLGRFLPQFFRDSTPDDRFLERWLALFETTAFDGIARRLDEYSELFDPRTAPEPMLPYLAAWLAMPVPPRIAADPARLRRILIAAPDVARRRGTIDGLVLIIRLYTDVLVQIRESFVTASRFVLGVGHTAGELTGAVLGCDTALSAECPPTTLGDSRLGCSNLLECDVRSGAVPHVFEVLAPAAALCDSEVRSLIELLVDNEKPAHTRHCLRAVAPGGWVVGVASVVGQSIADDFDRHVLDPDSYGIAIANGPPRPRPIGEGFTLGRDSRLAAAPGLPPMGVPASVGRTTRVADARTQ
jgi:phage tail-like protein